METKVSWTSLHKTQVCYYDGSSNFSAGGPIVGAHQYCVPAFGSELRMASDMHMMPSAKRRKKAISNLLLGYVAHRSLRSDSLPCSNSNILLILHP